MERCGEFTPIETEMLELPVVDVPKRKYTKKVAA